MGGAGAGRKENQHVGLKKNPSPVHFTPLPWRGLLLILSFLLQPHMIFIIMCAFQVGTPTKKRHLCQVLGLHYSLPVY
jgi:hypothetical protein